MAKYVAQLVVAGIEVVGRAFGKALKEEIRMSQQAAKARSSAQGGPGSGSRRSAADAYTGLTVAEAKQILNIEDIKDTEQLFKNHEHLFSVNDKAKGGSFYLQSKVVRAKERIDQELQLEEKAKADKTQQPEDMSTNGTKS